MNEPEVINEIKKKKTLTNAVLFSMLSSVFPGNKATTIYSKIDALIQQGFLYRDGRGHYRSDERKEFSDHLSPEGAKIQKVAQIFTILKTRPTAKRTISTRAVSRKSLIKPPMRFHYSIVSNINNAARPAFKRGKRWREPLFYLSLIESIGFFFEMMRQGMKEERLAVNTAKSRMKKKTQILN